MKATLLKWFTGALIVAAAFAFRLAYIDANPFSVDEAESSINALTILQHGYPTDTYLGLPIYENTSTQPWPGNPEYSFRDASYSDNHLAVYHGWLPLYSIAGSFAMYGIRPDEPDPPLAIKHDLAERKRRTAAGRMPGALFGVAFAVFTCAAGKMLYGDDAAWAGLLLGSLHSYAIGMSRQARYYSAEILLTTVCCVLAWLMVRRGQWKHSILSGLAFVLLFHTHLQSFFAGGLTVALAAPVILRLHPQSAKKLAVFLGIVATGTLPWLVGTRFYVQQARVPRAWPLLHFPGDLLRYPPFTYRSLAIAAVFATAMGGALLMPNVKVRRRIRTPLLRAAPVIAFFAAWVLCGYTSFLGTIPAVSFYSSRLNLSYWGPALVLTSIVFAAIARMIRWRAFGPTVAPAIALATIFLAGDFPRLPAPGSGKAWRLNSEVTKQVQAIGFNDQTKFYASPNAHLVWTFYTGLPIQSMGPIRQEYLNSYLGDIVYIDGFSENYEGLSADRIREASRRNGCGISNDSAEQWSRLLRAHDYRESMLKDIGGSPETQLEQVPEFSKGLIDASRERARRMFDSNGLELVSRGLGFEVRNWRDWRKAFLYRFSDNPAFQYSTEANYAERLRNSEAAILEDSEGSGVAIYHSRWHPSGSYSSIKFTFLQRAQPADVTCLGAAKLPAL